MYAHTVMSLPLRMHPTCITHGFDSLSLSVPPVSLSLSPSLPPSLPPSLSLSLSLSLSSHLSITLFYIHPSILLSVFIAFRSCCFCVCLIFFLSARPSEPIGLPVDRSIHPCTHGNTHAGFVVKRAAAEFVKILSLMANLVA